MSALPEEKETQPGMFQRYSPTGGGTSSTARGPLSLTREDGKVYPLRNPHGEGIYRNNYPLATNFSPHPVQIEEDWPLTLWTLQQYRGRKTGSSARGSCFVLSHRKHLM